MKDEIVTAILQEMAPVLDQEQLTRLKSVVRVQLCGYDISKKETGLMCADTEWSKLSAGIFGYVPAEWKI